jgi:hypothetical protein
MTPFPPFYEGGWEGIRERREKDAIEGEESSFAC